MDKCATGATFTPFGGTFVCSSYFTAGGVCVDDFLRDAWLWSSFQEIGFRMARFRPVRQSACQEDSGGFCPSPELEQQMVSQTVL